MGSVCVRELCRWNGLSVCRMMDAMRSTHPRYTPPQVFDLGRILPTPKDVQASYEKFRELCMPGKNWPPCQESFIVLKGLPCTENKWPDSIDEVTLAAPLWATAREHFVSQAFARMSSGKVFRNKGRTSVANSLMESCTRRCWCHCRRRGVKTDLPPSAPIRHRLSSNRYTARSLRWLNVFLSPRVAWSLFYPDLKVVMLFGYHTPGCDTLQSGSQRLLWDLQETREWNKCSARTQCFFFLWFCFFLKRFASFFWVFFRKFCFFFFFSNAKILKGFISW